MKKLIILLSVIFSVLHATAISYSVSISNSLTNGTIVNNVNSIDSGDVCHFYVKPNTGYHIDSVFANGTLCTAIKDSADGKVYEYIVTANTELSAVFEINTYQVTATCDTTMGLISPIGISNVEHGQSITFQFQPKQLCVLDSIYINDIYYTAPDTTSYYTFNNVTADSSIHVVFRLAQIITKVTVHGKGHVEMLMQHDSVVVNTSLIDTFVTDYINASFVADTGYQIDSVIINGINYISDNIAMMDVNEHQNIDVYFSRQSYEVTITYGPNGSGSIVGDTIMKYGDTLSLIIRPNAGYKLASVTVNQINASVSDSILRHIVTENCSISVTFEPIVPKITVICGPHGSVAYEYGDSTVQLGQSKQIWFNADNNYTVDSVIINGQYAGMMDNYTFYNVRGDSVVRVVFGSATCTITASCSNGGSISPSGSIVVNRGDSLRVSLVPNIGFGIEEVKINNIVRSVNGTLYTFHEIRRDSSIYVSYSGSLHNVILNVVGKGSVSPSTTQTVTHGSSLTYTFTPETGQHVDAVYVSGQYVGRKISSYTISNIQADSSIRVVFAPDTFQVAISCTPYGSITPYGLTPVTYGDSLACSFITATGCDIDSVLVNGINVGQPTSYIFRNITGDSTLHVVFKIRTYTVTGTTNNLGYISTDSASAMPDSIIMNYGENRIFYFIPNIGHHVDSVMVNNYYMGNPSSYTISNIQENINIDVKFAINTFRLIVHAGEHGMASLFDTTVCSYGEQKTVQFVPDAHYHVDSVWVNNNFIGIGLHSYQFAGIYGDSVLEVHFAIDSVKLFADCNTNGYMIPSGTIEIPYGDSQEVLFIPYQGNHVDSVYVNGRYIGRDTHYVFTNLCADSSIYVVFALDTFSIQASAAANGRIEPSGTLYLPFGSAQRYSITPETGYLIDSIFVNNEYAGNDSTYLFPYVSENATIYVTFKHQTFNVWAIAHENGSITPEDTSVVIYGSNLDLTITPDEYYKIADVHVNGVSVGAVSTYTLTNITKDVTIEAFFKLDSVTLTATSGPNGKIDPSGSVTVAMGSGMMYYFIPYKGYQIDSVYIDGVYNPQAVIDAGYTFERVKENGSIHVTFASMLSIAQSENDNILVYSNNRQIWIKNPDMKAFKQIVVYDITGRIVGQYHFVADNIIVLDTYLPKGLYIVRMLMQDNSGMVTKKVLIQ